MTSTAPPLVATRLTDIVVIPGLVTSHVTDPRVPARTARDSPDGVPHDRVVLPKHRCYLLGLVAHLVVDTEFPTVRIDAVASRVRAVHANTVICPGAGAFGGASVISRVMK